MTYLTLTCQRARAAGKWNGVTVAVKVVEHAVMQGGTDELREGAMCRGIVHPNVVSTYTVRTLCLSTGRSATLTAPPLGQPLGQPLAPCWPSDAGECCPAGGCCPGDSPDPCHGQSDCPLETWMLLVRSRWRRRGAGAAARGRACVRMLGLKHAAVRLAERSSALRHPAA